MMCWILFTHRLPLSSEDEKVLGRQHVSTEEKRLFSFLSLLWFFLELGTRLFFVFCYFGLHRQTHTQHSDDSPLMQTDNKKKRILHITVCCLFNTHTCMAYMLFVIKLCGKYSSYWQLYDYFTAFWDSWPGKKRHGNKTLLLLIKP